MSALARAVIHPLVVDRGSYRAPFYDLTTVRIHGEGKVGCAMAGDIRYRNMDTVTTGQETGASSLPGMFGDWV